MHRLPVLVRHPVDDLARLRVGERDAALLGGGAVPLGQAVPAEPGQVHDIDVLDIRALPEVGDEAAKRRGLELGASAVVDRVGHVLFYRVCYVAAMDAAGGNVTVLSDGTT